jgi:hypothetical protein
VIAAPLQSTSPFITAVGTTVTAIDAESNSETASITSALAACTPGQAVELSLGTTTSYNSFLVNPIVVPSGVSLIVDGGVTVYGSLDASEYQKPSTGSYCGVPSNKSGGCSPLLTFSGNDGLYGYGVIDGRGNGTLMCSNTALCGSAIGLNWWYFTMNYVAMGVYTQNIPMFITETGDNFTVYKITLRNTPEWNLSVVGNNETIWGLKEQATWTVPNTDGMDITGNNITVYDCTIANGDDAIAIGAYSEPSSNITINKITGYSRNGISTSTAIEWGISNVLVENSNLTGDVPSVVGTTVNGVTQAAMATVNGVSTGITSYADALPATGGYTRGLNIKNSADRAGQGSTPLTVQNFAYNSICIQDIDHPITQTTSASNNGTWYYPTLTNISYSNVHILAPNQFPVAGKNTGLYQPIFEGYLTSGSPPAAPMNDLHLNNVVFDDLTGGGYSLGQVFGFDTNFTNTGNVYPPPLNHFSAPYGTNDTGYSSGNTYLSLNEVAMLSTSATSTPMPAYSCPASNWPFLVGDLYASVGSSPATGSSTNLQSLINPAGNSITLNAMVEPAMMQGMYWVPGDYGVSPGLLDTGAPALTQPVNFYEGSNLVGTASLGANGTLASVVISNISMGTHTYYAQYPADTYYNLYKFGSVTVSVLPVGSTVTTLTAPSSGTYGAASALSVTVAGTSTTPTGNVTFYDGATSLGTQVLVNGAASLNPILTGGTHNLTAVYAGDSTNAPSTSAVSSVVIAQSISNMTFNIFSTVLSANTPTLFMATLTGVSGAPSPSGTVTFSNGGTTMGSATLTSGGVATLVANLTTLGVNTITATYNGDVNYTGSNGTKSVTVSSLVAVGGCMANP